MAGVGNGQGGRLDIATGGTQNGRRRKDEMTAHPTPAPEAHFDVVVVGSGFGGSVMTQRLSQAGLSVCLLERGKAYPPGSFARSPWEIGRSFWDPSEGLQGLFDVWSFRGLGGFVASGLGGGSLVYSNVLIRKDESTFVQDELETWPVEYKDLEAHYERHEDMLAATPYPFEPDPAKRDPAREPFDRTYKTNALHDAAERLGLEWRLPKLAVAFSANGGPPGLAEPILGEPENIHGRVRTTCRLCGECNIGCNYGSKNTLDFNYLSDAALRHGASIFTRCEVKTFAPRPGGGYTVGYVDHSQAVEGEKRTEDLPVRTVTCDRLVLAAGTFGSTYLLLKNRAAFPQLSERLGTRFCGNGDLLTFALKSHEDGPGRRPRNLDPGYGPVITSTIRVPDALEGGPGRAFYIQDGGQPQIASWIIEIGHLPSVLRRAVRLAVRLVRKWLRIDRRSDIGREISAAFGPGTLSSSSMLLFGMGRDIPDGNMTMTDDGFLAIDWKTRRSNAFFEQVRATGKDIAEVLDAKFLDNPPWHLSRVVTVHPLGGCPMGRNEREGVVDSYGRVFGHPGLLVVDGSMMPGPVGPNPSNTIAALAHRAAEQLIKEAR
jgi:cholesterol oxidase